jgi:hypothetical protein
MKLRIILIHRFLFADVRSKTGTMWHRAVLEQNGWLTLCGRTIKGPVCWNERSLTMMRTAVYGASCERCR